MKSDEELMMHAVDLVLSMMSMASTDNIRPIDWWPRAQSALEAATARARTWGELVSIMAEKLEIRTIRKAQASSICSFEPGPQMLRQWKRVVRTQAVYIVALAQVERERQREEAKEA